jgi:predicted PurR-regulated permease PerM
VRTDPWLRALIVLLTIIAAWYLAGQVWALVQHFADVLALFFLAWLLAFVLTPLAVRLRQATGLPWGIAVGLVYLLLLLVVAGGLVLLVPLAVEQIAQLGAALTRVVEQLPATLATLQAALDARGIEVDLKGLYRTQDLAARLTALIEGSVPGTIGLLTGAANLLFSVVLILVLSFYIALDGERLLVSALALLPPERRADALYIGEVINRSFGGFLRGTLVQALVYGVGTALVMLVVGLNYVLVSGLFAMVMMVIPFIGPLLAMVPPVLIALLTGSLTQAVVVTVALIALQQVVFNVLGPKLMGQAVGLHPLLVFLALLVGMKVAGLAGAVFGIPVAAALWTIARFVLQRTALTAWTPAPAPAPSARRGGRTIHRMVLGRLWAWLRTRRGQPPAGQSPTGVRSDRVER